MSIIQEALKKAQGTYAVKVTRPDVETAAKDVVEDKVFIQPDLAGALRPPKSHERIFTKPLFIPAVIVLTIIIRFGLRLFLTDTSAVRSKEPDRSHQDVSYKAVDRVTKPTDQSNAGAVVTAIKSSIPANFMAGQAPTLTLNGVMYLQESPRAIINGSMVGEGDTVSGAKVIAIDRDEVTLDYNNTEISLKLKE